MYIVILLLCTYVQSKSLRGTINGIGEKDLAMDIPEEGRDVIYLAEKELGRYLPEEKELGRYLAEEKELGRYLPEEKELGRYLPEKDMVESVMSKALVRYVPPVRDMLEIKEMIIYTNLKPNRVIYYYNNEDIYKNYSVIDI